MSEWAQGYVTDIAYTYGYYTELNPLRASFALTRAGYEAPRIRTACELGFGQGMSINIHAAASGVEWHGNDFNPGQVAFARELASQSGASLSLYEDSFAEFTARDDLPGFDYIGVHGIWSWIDDANRTEIRNFVRRNLNPGGVLYISYNNSAGWAPFAPVRELMFLHNKTVGSPATPIGDRLEQAIKFVEKLNETNPIYARGSQQVAGRFNSLKNQLKNYLVHEYFNDNWHPMSISQLANWLDPAKVSYACSAHYADHIDLVNLTNEQRAFLGEITDPILREVVRDYISAQSFRRDYWVKGARQISATVQKERLDAQRIILTQPAADVSLKVNGILGEATLNEDVYLPIIAGLADHDGPMTIGELTRAVGSKKIGFGEVIQAAVLLGNNGVVVPAADDAAIAAAKPHTDKLNNALTDRARVNNEIVSLASPVTGGGVNVARFQQLFLLASRQGVSNPDELVRFAWSTLQAQGQKLLHEGKTVEKDEDNIAILRKHEQEYSTRLLPIFKALGLL